MKYFAKLVVVFFLLSISTPQLFSQTEKQLGFVPKVEYQCYGGIVLAHRDDMDSLAKGPFFGNELRMGFQTTGTQNWHQLYNYPVFGVGFYSANFFNEIIGKPKALFLFMELPFVRNNKHVLSTSWGIGCTFNINEYNEVTNPQNIAIGSDMNVFVDFCLAYKYHFAERWETGAGIKLQHFSNGAYAYPNLGLNMPSGFASVTFYPGKTIKNFNKPTEPEGNKKKYEFTGMFASAWRSKDIDHNDVRYYNATTSVSINKRVSQKRLVGVGFDHFYQSYLIDYYPEKSEVDRTDLMSYAGFLSSDMVVSKFRVIVQMGFYMYRPVDYGKFYYERVGLRYYPTEHMFANFSIKAHAAKAEFIEWGLGVTF